MSIDRLFLNKYAGIRQAYRLVGQKHFQGSYGEHYRDCLFVI